jgi:hypothetical protein
MLIFHDAPREVQKVSGILKRQSSVPYTLQGFASCMESCRHTAPCAMKLLTSCKRASATEFLSLSCKMSCGFLEPPLLLHVLLFFMLALLQPIQGPKQLSCSFGVPALSIII